MTGPAASGGDSAPATGADGGTPDTSGTTTTVPGNDGLTSAGVNPGTTTDPNATTGTGTDPSATPTDPPVDPAAEKKLKDARDEAAKNRVAKTAAEKAAKEAADKHAAFIDGLNKLINPDGDKDKPVDPAALTGQVTELTASNAALQAQLRTKDVRLSLWESGAEFGANMPELMDSAAFLRTVDGLDPTADDYKTVLGEAIKAAVDSNPRFKAVQALEPSSVPSGGDFGGGPGGSQIDDTSVEGFLKQRPKPL